MSKPPIFVNPHCLVIAASNGIVWLPSMTPDWTETRGPFNEVDLDRPKELELAHYITKSRRECQVRRSYRRADTGAPREEGWEAFFAEHDVNEIEDCEVRYE